MKPRIIQFAGELSLNAHLEKNNIPRSAVQTVNHPVFKYRAPAQRPSTF